MRQDFPAAVLAVVALIAPEALAAPVTVDEAMREVAVMVARGDYAVALGAIEEARPLASSVEDQATLAGWQSLIFYASNRYDDAKLAMRACLELSPLAAPPPGGPRGYSHDFELMRRAVRRVNEVHPESVGKSAAAVQLVRATRPVKPARRAGAILAVGGAVLVAGGAVLMVHSRRDFTRIEDATTQFPLALSDARDLASAGSIKQGIGIGCLAGGGAAVLTALILLAVSADDAPVTPQVALVPGGVGIGIAGRLP